MTDRTRYLTVILDKDVRVDDVEEVVAALKMIRCVEDVRIGLPPNHIEREVAKLELWRELSEFMQKLRLPY